MRVSVVVPVHNAERFIERAVESVLGQSYRDIELLLVDDGSSDTSADRCSAYASNDSRVSVITQENRGPAAARNTGIDNASGDFIFFLDADDYLEPETLEKLIACHHKYQPDLVMANFRKLEVDGRIIDQRAVFSPDNIEFDGWIKALSAADIRDYVRHFFKYPSNHPISYCWARLYKRSIIEREMLRFDETMRLFEDFVFNLAYLKRAYMVIFVNEPLYTYTMHSRHVSFSMSILNAESLVHDMTVFRQKASDFFQVGADMDADRIAGEIGHTLIHYVIIFFIRSCRLTTRHNRKKIYARIRTIITSSIYRESLPHYVPQKGNSRIFPFLTRMKLIALTIYYCRHKAYKRYGKPIVQS